MRHCSPTKHSGHTGDAMSDINTDESTETYNPIDITEKAHERGSEGQLLPVEKTVDVHGDETTVEVYPATARSVGWFRISPRFARRNPIRGIRQCCSIITYEKRTGIWKCR